MREPYFPVFTSVVRSSLWSLSGDCIKVFLTLCAESDPEGFVSASADGIRRLADLPLEDTRAHLARLEAPDCESKDRTRDATVDGRRIERVPNGWRIINLQWYRELARKEAELSRKRKWWNEKGSAARRAARPTETETETETTLSERESQSPLPVPETSPHDSRTHASPPRMPQDSLLTAAAPLDGVIQVNPRKGRVVPADFAPTETHRMRCQELRLEVGDVLHRFRLQEFNRDYSDWDKRFSLWIEEQKVRNETEKARPRGKGVPVDAEPTWTVRHILQEHRSLCQDHGLGDVEKLARAWLKNALTPPTLLEGEQGFTQHLRSLVRKQRAGARP